MSEKKQSKKVKRAAFKGGSIRAKANLPAKAGKRKPPAKRGNHITTPEQRQQGRQESRVEFSPQVHYDTTAHLTIRMNAAVCHAVTPSPDGVDCVPFHKSRPYDQKVVGRAMKVALGQQRRA